MYPHLSWSWSNYLQKTWGTWKVLSLKVFEIQTDLVMSVLLVWQGNMHRRNTWVHLQFLKRTQLILLLKKTDEWNHWKMRPKKMGRFDKTVHVSCSWGYLEQSSKSHTLPLHSKLVAINLLYSESIFFLKFNIKLLSMLLSDFSALIYLKKEIW